MGEYYFESNWLKLLIFLTIVFVLLYLFHVLMRRWLKVEEKKLFSYNHVNDKHKKIDWTFRITTILLLILGWILYRIAENPHQYWFLQPWYIITFFIIVSETVRAFMEWKYAENRNTYKLTLFDLVFFLLLLLILLWTDFFGFTIF